jgi:hypothetical protein
MDFGVDSFIEVTSGSALLWRMSMDADAHRREAVERRSLRIVGVCFLALAAYVAVEAIRDHADASQTEFCTYLSAILLGGLLLNLVWGLWWADPIAALLMVPIITKEGIDALRGDPCCD